MHVGWDTIVSIMIGVLVVIFLILRDFSVTLLVGYFKSSIMADYS
jgi:hypothetical protein